MDASALLSAPSPTGATEQVRFEDARRAQAERAARLGLRRASNARIPAAMLQTAVAPTPEAIDAVLTSARRFSLTGRGIHRALRVARTVADLAGSERVLPEHVAVALQYRGEDG